MKILGSKKEKQAPSNKLILGSITALILVITVILAAGINRPAPPAGESLHDIVLDMKDKVRRD